MKKRAPRFATYLLAAPLVLALAVWTALLFTPQGQSILVRIDDKRQAGELEQTARQVMRGLVARFTDGPSVADMAVESTRSDLPELITVPALETNAMTPSTESSSAAYRGASWTHSFGDAGSTKFSDIPWLTVPHIRNLEYAWTYETPEVAANIQATPVFTGRYIVFPDALDRIVALRPDTGEVAWQFDPGLDAPARRGLIFVPNTIGPAGAGLIYFAAAGRVFALDAVSGEANARFGAQGEVSVGYSIRVAPQSYGDILLVASFMPGVHAINRNTGKHLWTADLLTGEVTSTMLGRWMSGEVGFDGANPWGGMSLDTERGLLFLTLSNPVPVAYGATRAGDNAPANSVIAIDASTGELVWRFQEIMHDLWDLDIAAPPVLGKIERDGGFWDIVAVATKAGNLIVLDRLTGRPVFDWRLRRAPTSNVPGERTSAYQPDPELPEPFGRMAFTKDDVTDIGVSNRVSVLDQLEEARYGFYVPHEPDRQTVFFGLHGGAMHMGAALDPQNNVLFVAASHVPSSFTIAQEGSRTSSTITQIDGAGAEVYREFCAACHGDRLEGGNGPTLSTLDPSFSRGRFFSVVRNGVRAMPAVPDLSPEETDALYRMLVLGVGVERLPPVNGSNPEREDASGRYRRTAYQRLSDHEGFPGSKPPWGTLTAINLSTGQHVWRVPLGRYDELIARDIPQTGTVNLSGPVVTSGGVVFVSGTTDRLLRAFDGATGQEVWEAALPFVGSASPIVFEYDGAAYVIVPATGGGTLSYYDPTIETGSTFVAFKVGR